MSSLPPPPFDPPPPPPGGNDQPWPPTQPMPAQPAQPAPPAYPPTQPVYPPTTQVTTQPAAPPPGYPPTGQMPPQPGQYPPGQYPGQPARYPGFGTPPPPITPPKKKKTGLIVGLGAVGALALGGGIFALTQNGDDKDAKPAVTEVSVAETEAVVTTVAESTTTFAPITLPPATIPPETTEAPADPGIVDLGGGITFAAPEGYTFETGPSGEVNLTNGTANMFIQVLQRSPGEDPMVLMQEYIDNFDANFASIGFSQSVPYSDSSTVPVTDGAFVFYRSLNADGSGFDGALDVNRRADGLVMIADRFVTLAEPDAEKFPSDLYDEIFATFYATPSQGAEVELPPLTPVRVNTTHVPLLVDGLVGITPPPGWVVDNPGPGRVAISTTTGQRWVSGRLGDTTDLNVAQAEAQAELVAVVPDAVFDPPEDVESGDYATRDVTWTGTAPDGGKLNGVISVWVHPTIGDAWVGAYSFREDSSPGDPFFEYNFLLRVFDLSIINSR